MSAGIPIPSLNVTASPKSAASTGPLSGGPFGDFSVQFGGVGGAGAVPLLGWGALALAGLGLIFFAKKKAA